MSCSLSSARTLLCAIAICSIGVPTVGLADPGAHRSLEGTDATNRDDILQPSVACGSATVLSLDSPVAGDTTAATNSYQAAATCFATGVGQVVTTAPGPDTVFQFTVPADAPVGGKYSFRATKPDATGDLVVYVGECPSPGSPPQTVTCSPVGGGANRGSGNRAEEAMCLTLAPAQTVYVYVDDAAAGTHTFTLEVNRCTTETEPNGTVATANSPLVCGLEGSSSVTPPAAENDFFSLGTFANGERVFAMADGSAAVPTGAFDMRITNTTNTLEYDNNDNDAPFGEGSPNIAGRQLPNQAAYVRINGNTTEPYRLYSVVQPAIGSAVDESEPNDTVATADADPLDYFKGTLSRTATTADTDFFHFCAQAGDLIFLSLDADPQRNLTPINPSLRILFGSTALLTVNDGDSTSTATPGGADALNKSDPTSPAEALTWRVRATESGFYNARVTMATGTPDITLEDYLLSISINCQTAAQRATDLRVMKSFDDASVAVGESTSYTVTLSNNGPNRADFVDLRDPIPPGTIFLGKTADPAGWTCTTPALGGTGEIACTNNLFAAGAPPLTYTVSVKVLDRCADIGSAVTRVTSCTLDPTPGNNSDDGAPISVTGSCSDNDPCTENDHCSGGSCVGDEVSCEDDNACTADSCEPDRGCVNRATAGSCDDGNACTDDACSTLDVCGPATSATFTRTLDPPRPIQDNRTVTSTITVADAGSYLWDVNLRTFIAHTNNDDLEVTLKSPAGTIVTITSDNGGTNDNVFNGTLWDDSADPGHEAPFATDTFATSGLVTDTRFTDGVPKTTLVPEEALAAFIGENPNGVWTLTISDDLANSEQGALSSWSLTIGTLPTAPIETTPPALTNNTSQPIAADAETVVTSTITAAGLGTQLGKLRLTTHPRSTSSISLGRPNVSLSGTRSN